MSVRVRRPLAESRHPVERLVAIFNACNCFTYGNIANGTTAGKLKTQNTTVFRAGGQIYTKGATDDLWDFTGVAALTAGQYQAFWLMLSAAGTPLAVAVAGVAGTVKTSAALALADLPAPDGSNGVAGCFVAGSAGTTDFTAALSSQGTIYHGVPDGASRVISAPMDLNGIADPILLVNL